MKEQNSTYRFRIQLATYSLVLLFLAHHAQGHVVISPRTPKAKGSRLTPLASAAVADSWSDLGQSDSVHIFSGYSDEKKDTFSSSLWLANGRDWRFIQDISDRKLINAPTARKDAACWSIRNSNASSLFIYGGIAPNTADGAKQNPFVFLNDLRVLDLVSNTWTLLSTSVSPNASTRVGADPAPGARASAARWASGTEIFLFGGYGFDRSGDFGIMDDLWTFSVITKRWSLSRFSRPNSPGSRASASISRFGSDVYLFGGLTISDSGVQVDSNDIWKWSGVTRSWSLVFAGSSNGTYETVRVPSSTAQPGPRHGAVSFFDGRKLWIFGGSGFGPSGTISLQNDLWSFDVTTSQWTWEAGDRLHSSVISRRTEALFWPRHGDSTQASLWLYGGFTTSGVSSGSWEIQPNYETAAVCSEQPCSCSGVPIADNMRCVDGAWVFISNASTETFVVNQPLPLDLGSTWDIKLHTVEVVGDISISGTIQTSFDATSAFYGAVNVKDGCPYFSGNASLEIEVSGLSSLVIDQARTISLIQWDPVMCANITVPSFSSVVAVPDKSLSQVCGSVRTSQVSSSSGSLSVLFTFIPDRNCLSSQPAASGGGVVDIPSSSFSALPVVFGVLAIVAVGLVVAGVIVYRRRTAIAADKVVGAAVSQYSVKPVASLPSAAVPSTDADWWIEIPESPRSVASVESDGTVPQELKNVIVQRSPVNHVIVGIADSSMLTPRVPAAPVMMLSPPSAGSVKQNSINSSVHSVADEVAGSEESSASTQQKSRITISSGSRTRHLAPGGGSSSHVRVESDAGSESDSASISPSDEPMEHRAALIRSYSSPNRAVQSLRRDKLSSSDSMSSSFTNAYADINEKDVVIDESKQLGTGSLGIVYLGRWADHRVAVRRTSLFSFDDCMNVSSLRSVLFMSELRAIVEMRPHKYVHRVFGHFLRQSDSSHFIVGEYCPRGSLKSVLETGVLTVREKVKLIERAAYGLAHLHEQSVLMHRHMRAASILLDSAMRPKLADYGMLLSEQGTSSDRMNLISRARWLAPEVLRSGTFSTASDVFSFGVFISEVLTEETPYANLTDEEVMVEALDSSISVSVPEWCSIYLREVAEVCINPNPRERPNMDDVVALLRMVRRGSIASELESV